MKHLKSLMIVALCLLLTACDRDIWKKNEDATVSFELNKDVNPAKRWDAFAKAPTSVFFKDNDDGFFYFPDDNKEVPFQFIDEGNGVFKVKVDDDIEEKRLEVKNIGSKRVCVKFVSSQTWIVYDLKSK